MSHLTEVACVLKPVTVVNRTVTAISHPRTQQVEMRAISGEFSGSSLDGPRNSLYIGQLFITVTNMGARNM